MKLRNLALSGTALALTTALSACGGGVKSLDSSGSSGGGTSKDAGSVTIGTANFTENVVLGYLYQGALKAKGISATVKPNLGSREVVVPALKNGQLDVIPEYQGSLLLYLDEKATQSSAEDVQTALKSKLPQGLEVLPYAAAEDADVFVVTKETATKDGLTTLADLAKHNGQYTFGGPAEDKTRTVGIVGLQQVYGITFKDFKSLDAGGPLTKAALQKDQVQVANLFSTDQDIKTNGWVVLSDPKNLIPAQHIVPLVSAKASARIAPALAALNDKLTTDQLRELDAKVDIQKQDPDQVAKDWLKANGFTA